MPGAWRTVPAARCHLGQDTAADPTADHRTARESALGPARIAYVLALSGSSTKGLQGSAGYAKKDLEALFPGLLMQSSVQRGTIKKPPSPPMLRDLSL